VNGKLNCVKVILERFTVADIDFGTDQIDSSLQEEQANYHELIKSFESMREWESLMNSVPKNEKDMNLEFQTWKHNIIVKLNLR
jgi:hypothetical protein